MATQAWGPICLMSDVFDFTETSFYADTMGSDLRKQFIAFEHLIDPGDIAQTKIQSNHWELEFARTNKFPEQRPLNIDPGYITEAKLVLVTTKDRDHRIYLKDGIFAEITLYYRAGRWTKSRWTYPDYQREDFQRFFEQCREYLRARYRNL